jgi:coenzyme A diphosphatase NUDT7
MKFEQLTQKLSKRTPKIMGSEKYTRFSVLVPLIEINKEIHVLFEIRAVHLRRQPGEICFPGGKYDTEDISAQHTAVRETCEELGIDEEEISTIFQLDYIVSPFGSMIFPFVGVVSEDTELKPNADEVGETFTVPLSYFMNTKPECYKIHIKVEPEEQFPFQLISGGENYKWQMRGMNEYFYQYEDKVIWGLTARILLHFVEEVKRIGLDCE